MSEQRKTKAIFEERHTDYLIEWSMKPDQVLATELNSIFHQNFKADDIAEKRSELKLPPPNRDKSIERAILPKREQKTEPERPMSAAQVMHRSKPKKKPAIKEDFEIVSNEVQDTLDKLLEKKRGSGDFTFKPVYVTQTQQGKIYVYPGRGPVECGGITTIAVGGIDMKTVSFTQIHAVGARGTVRFDPEKIAGKFVRELATPDDLENLLYKLVTGKASLKGLPRHATQQKVFYEQILASSDLTDLANLLCHTFKNEKTIGNRGSHEITYGNLCLDLIAAEYAVVNNVPIDNAKDLLKRAVGKPTLDQLSRFNDGRTRDEPKPETP